MRKVGVHDSVATLFRIISWRGFLILCDDSYEHPTMELLSIFTRDDEADVHAFQLQGQIIDSHRDGWILSWESIDESPHIVTNTLTSCALLMHTFGHESLASTHSI